MVSFCVQDVCEGEMWTFEDGEVEEVDSMRGVFVCETEVRVEGVELREEMGEILCGTGPDEKDVIDVAC